MSLRSLAYEVLGLLTTKLEYAAAEVAEANAAAAAATTAATVSHHNGQQHHQPQHQHQQQQQRAPGQRRLDRQQQQLLAVLGWLRGGISSPCQRLPATAAVLAAEVAGLLLLQGPGGFMQDQVGQGEGGRGGGCLG